MRKGILLGLGAGLLVLSGCGNSKPTLVEVTCEDLVKSTALAYYWSDGSRDLWIDVGKNNLCVALPEEESGSYHTHYPPKP